MINVLLIYRRCKPDRGHKFALCVPSALSTSAELVMLAAGAQYRLAAYGSLAPGRPNHHQVGALAGHWSEGQVYGRLIDAGWGAGLGYPALILDPGGAAISVQVFESMDLPDHWSRLDDFEGPGYQRVVTTVRTLAGDAAASIYVLPAS